MTEQQREPWDTDIDIIRDEVDGPVAVDKMPLDAKLELVVRDHKAKRAAEAREAAKRPVFKPWTYEELTSEPPQDWCVGTADAPMLLAGGLWTTFGIFKSGKTFYLLDQAICQSEGKEFLGHPIKQGTVAYLLAEGGKTKALERIEALCVKHGLDIRDVLNSGKFNFIPTAVNLADPDAKRSGLNELLRVLEPLHMQTVYLDTWARMLQASGSHDSDPKIVAQALRGCDRLREELGCAVNVAAHVGLKEQWRLKGMSDFEGMIDGATRCEKTGEGPGAVFTFESVFQRHAEDGFKLSANLVKAGQSAYLAVTSELAIKRDNLKPDDRRCYDILLGLIKRLNSDDVDGVTIDMWRNEAKGAGLWPSASDGTWRSNWKRTKEALEGAGLVEYASGQVYLKQ